MKTTADKIRELRKVHKVTQRQLATTLGISREAVSLWESGNTKPSGESLVSLARYFRCREADLLDDSYAGPTFKVESPTAEYLVSGALKRIPIFNSEQVKHWMDSKIRPNQNDVIGTQVTALNVSDAAWAFRATDKSMQNPAGYPSIPHMAVVVVEPQQQAISGNIVAVLVHETSAVIIKKLVIDGQHAYLEPLNPDYRPMIFDDKYTILGVVKQVIQDL